MFFLITITKMRIWKMKMIFWRKFNGNLVLYKWLFMKKKIPC